MNDMINHNKVSKNDTYCMVYGFADEEGRYTQYRLSDVSIEKLPEEAVKMLSEGFDVTLSVVPPNEVAAFVKSWDIWERYLEEVGADADYLFDILEEHRDYDSTPLWSVHKFGYVWQPKEPESAQEK